MSEITCAICLDHVSLSINNHRILDNISMRADYGRMYGIIGKNGAGKSVLLRAIAGLIPYQSGTVMVDGKLVKAGSSFYEELGICFEDSGFLPNRTGFRALKELSSIRDIISTEDVMSSLRAVNLDPECRKKYKAYSRGMKKRLCLAQALMENPKILLLDEPMNGLDSENVKNIYEILKVKAENGCCILICSHYPDDINILCSEVFAMDTGHLRKESAP